MTTVYADNYRGFTNTYVDLQAVNFFVGENSSGKTSLIALAHQLFEPMFSLSNEIPTSMALAGHYSDLVSIHANDKSRFSIGVVRGADAATDIPKEHSDREQYIAVLWTYTNANGLPKLAELQMQEGRLWVHARFGKIVEFRFLDDVLPQQKTRPFAEWLGSKQYTSVEFSELTKVPEGVDIRASLFGLLFSIYNKVREVSKRKGIPPLPSMNSTPMVWLAPIRTKPKRTYDEYRFDFSSEGEHVPYVIQKILSNKRDATAFEKYMKAFGEESGLFDSVKIKRHGRGGTAPFELDVVLNRRALGISNVGYGVSQSLPIVVELFTRPPRTLFAIQQPEVHLHPRAQAALGDLIFRLAVIEQKGFCVETHSDYLIDRFRLNFRYKKEKISAQILYFERGKKGNVVHQLMIDDNGQLPIDQPDGYRRFFVNEALSVLDVE